ncbi:hypothetical protein [Streptomyces sp. SAI-127]|uniref:hypothetical protein n=1 Tax=Streptomyces sp. SAI-127 TaxID=2940543 RepID=UPI002476536B|nr:hypothetical protein [Streptomyces sp. SAI-127]MDH6489684.1 hypothetical protein [Streptomyces sp. SAI-127]
MARCGCAGGACNCTVEAGTNVVVSGSGSAANPYVISSDVPCADVRACLSAGPGINLDQGTGQISADLSGQAGNNIVIGADGGLLVPTAGGQVLTGCGLSGNGSGASPVKANTQAWPYACNVDTFGGVVACDSQGRLRSEPRGKVSFTSYSESRDYNDIAVPAAQNTVLDNFAVTITNPDTCRPAVVYTEREVDVYLVLPAGAGAGTGHGSDEMYYTRNTGTSTIVGAHSQSTKFVPESFTLGPGATAPISLNATAGRGSGGAYYYQIIFILRALIISL